MLPNTDILKDYGNKGCKVKENEIKEKKSVIIDTLKSFDIDIATIKATAGATVTLFEVVPEKGTRITKIRNLEEDIALALSALSVRIIAPMPGKGTIGIEVPNSETEIVSIREVLEDGNFKNSKAALPMALGKTIANETYVADLAKMPHLLIAGATGQGKSVGINVILASLLYSKNPEDLKFVLIDPKKVELTLYNKLKDKFLAEVDGEAVIKDPQKAIKALEKLVELMEKRYDILNEAKVKNIAEYNDLPTCHMPYIVLVIDEFADLMMVGGKEVETPIIRIAQLARAVGIHLIIATQRPSVNIITGLIKANFPARIAYRTISAVDSRTILDSKGAEQLIGKGDMIISTGKDTTRLQCAFIDTPEINSVVEHYEAQSWVSTFVISEDKSREELIENTKKQKVMNLALYFAEVGGTASHSRIQRYLKVSYSQADGIRDILQEAGLLDHKYRVIPYACCEDGDYDFIRQLINEQTINWVQ